MSFRRRTEALLRGKTTLMEYLVYARKYRPKTFEDMIGQKAVVQTLQNAIKNNRVAQAYLFSGMRGVGKTVFLKDTPAVRGMLYKVVHLVEVTPHDGTPPASKPSPGFGSRPAIGFDGLFRRLFSERSPARE